MSDLVDRLSHGEHPVEINTRPQRTATAFKECIDRGYVHVKFTDTRGGTELGIRLNQELTNFAEANFDKALGTVTLVGSLTLDYVKVQCIANVDLSTLAGTGHLEIEREQALPSVAN